ncbi:3-hydroxyisobutyrate dehydrogenase [Rathayibacter oskolensis]|uniref:3-hydroxyisobutyrate dehydrogenase n=1 Tax=Rathayibacter oskolensis TaxID=1891671 RepID=A0A1X7NXW7_9MICO|nr:NAD(P)-dependent oxidoreductase [Rathayibacter oskolensis]SMH42798.1 3-hydroxyisobutyrate dehydrogenase [Rathayibacter oskolensis]
MSRRIGILGYGRMGAPVARRLHRHGFDVTVSDIDEGALERARAEGLPTAPDGGALAARSDTLITVLPGPIECRDALTGADGALGALAPGGVWLDFTSNDPRSVSALVVEAAGRGVGSVAAPMRGGPADAAAGTLGFYLAGEPAEVREVSGILTALGHDGSATVVQTDPALGHVAKLIANTLWFGQVIAVTEVLLLGRALGWDPSALHAALLESPGASAFLERHAPSILAGDPLPDFSLGRVVEELETVLRLAEEAGTPHETIELVTRLHREALASFGDVDGELLAAALLEERAGRPLSADVPSRRDTRTEAR